MQTFKWLYTPTFNWRFILNVIIRALLLFVVLNVLFALLNLLPTLGRISAYNHLFDGRERLPYGENSAISYNLSLFQLDAMFKSHVVAGSPADDEYRVLLIGDSSTWGWLLEPQDTLAGQINQGNYRTADGKQVRAYNLAYPTMSLTKDLLLLDYAKEYDPDLIIWLFTLESFNQAAQLDTDLVQNNPDPVRDLIEKYHLNQDTDDSSFVERSFWEKTIVGQRRALADLLRLQYYGVAWAITGIDQEYPDDYERLMIDLEPDETWQDYDPETITADDLAFDVLQAGIELAGDTPILLINEPMFISEGQNSATRYNFFYPRAIYDKYREWLHQQQTQHDWQMLDWWDMLPSADCYTDSAVHLTPICSAQFAQRVGEVIIQTAANRNPE
jgi:hypothetical protein